MAWALVGDRRDSEVAVVVSLDVGDEPVGHQEHLVESRATGVRRVIGPLDFDQANESAGSGRRLDSVE